MTQSLKVIVISAFTRLMRPLVRILLRNGVSFGELSELLKRLYVEAAVASPSLAGHRPSPSKISIATGLSKAEVNRLIDAPPLDHEKLEDQVNRVGRLLAAWHQSMEFTGPYGVPLELPFESNGPQPCFSRLVQRAGITDIAPEDMLNELIGCGAVQQLPSGVSRVLDRSYLPSPTDPAALEFMTQAFTDLAGTLDRNLSTTDTDSKFFERRVWSPVGVPLRLFDEFRQMVESLGQQFLEELDLWITGAESQRGDDEQLIHIGVATYLFKREELDFRKS